MKRIFFVFLSLVYGQAYGMEAKHANIIHIHKNYKRFNEIARMNVKDRKKALESDVLRFSFPRNGAARELYLCENSGEIKVPVARLDEKKRAEKLARQAARREEAKAHAEKKSASERLLARPDQKRSEQNMEASDDEEADKDPEEETKAPEEPKINKSKAAKKNHARRAKEKKEKEKKREEATTMIIKNGIIISPIKTDDLVRHLFHALATNENKEFSIYLNTMKQNKINLNTLHPNNGYNILLAAAAYDSVYVLEQLGKTRGCDFTIEDREGNALFNAVHHDRRAALEYLLDNHAIFKLDPRKCDQYHQKLIHRAAETGSLDCMNYLLDHKLADVEERIESKDARAGATPLLVAAGRGYWRSMETLLERHRANFSAQTVAGECCLHVAIRERERLQQEPNNTENQTKLLNQNITLEQILKYDQKLIESKQPGYTSVVNMRDAKGLNALDLCAAVENIPLMKLLISCGAPVNPERCPTTPLMQAISQKHLEAARVLLNEHHANPNLINDDGVSPIHWAAGYGTPDLIDVLIAHGSDCNSVIAHTAKALHKRCTPLSFAVLGKNIDTLKHLVTRYPEVMTKDYSYSAFALIFAFMMKFEEGAEYLIDQKAYTSIELYGSRNLLHDAADNGWVSIMRKLIALEDEDHQKIFDIHEEDKEGNTALYYAGKKNHAPAIQLLLECGATIEEIKKDTSKLRKIKERILAIQAAMAAEAKKAETTERKAPAKTGAPAKTRTPAKKPETPKTESKAPRVRISTPDIFTEQYPNLMVTGTAKKSISKMPELEQAHIKPDLQQLNDGKIPELLAIRDKLKKLQGVDNQYRVYCGNYRIVFEKPKGPGKITIVRVGPRKNIY